MYDKSFVDILLKAIQRYTFKKYGTSNIQYNVMHIKYNCWYSEDKKVILKGLFKWHEIYKVPLYWMSARLLVMKKGCNYENFTKRV